MDTPAKLHFIFILSNHAVLIVLIGCATVVVLMMVAACIFVKRRRQSLSANATKRDRRRPGKGTTYIADGKGYGGVEVAILIGYPGTRGFIARERT